MKGSECGIKLMMALSKKKERCDGGGGRLKPLLHIVSQMFSFGSALILLLPLTS